MVAGGVVGAIVGAIVAVNVVIYAGPDTGYQSSIGDVFEHDVFVGFLTVTVLLAGPVTGVVIARRRRKRHVC